MIGKEDVTMSTRIDVVAEGEITDSTLIDAEGVVHIPLVGDSIFFENQECLVIKRVFGYKGSDTNVSLSVRKIKQV